MTDTFDTRAAIWNQVVTLGLEKALDSSCDAETTINTPLSMIHADSDRDVSEMTLVDRKIELADYVLQMFSFSSSSSSWEEEVSEVDEEAEELEPILNPNLWSDLLRQAPMHPKQHFFYDLWKTHIDTHWPFDAVFMAEDEKKFHTDAIGNAGRQVIKMVLSFFARGDSLVADNIADNFGKEICVPEVRAFLNRQQSMEDTHQEAYLQMLEALVPSNKEREDLLEGVSRFNTSKRKHDWTRNWMNDSRPFAERILAFACVEGIMFSASFCIIFYFGRTNCINGLRDANKWIASDEALHVRGAVAIYDWLKNKCTTERVHEIIRDAVNVEFAFVDEALPPSNTFSISDAMSEDGCDSDTSINSGAGGGVQQSGNGLLGLTNEKMRHYVEYVADYMCQQLGVPLLYNRGTQPNPCSWMRNFALFSQTNQFEKMKTEYSTLEQSEEVPQEAFDGDCDV